MMLRRLLRALSSGGCQRALVAGTTLAFAACSPEMDRIYEVDTLRVLAVQKTVSRDGAEDVGAAYARPGERVRFHMLWDRGARNRAADIPVQRLWIKGCINPKGDSYIGCAALFAQAAQDPAAFVEQNVVRPEEAAARPSPDDTIEVEMPGSDMLRRPDDGEGPPYALYIVFFAACAGEIGVSGENVSIADGRLPITCTRDGAQLGADDFVVGYSSVYVYEEHQNDNPRIDSLFFTDFEQLSIASITAPRFVDPEQAPATGCSGIGCLLVPEPTTEADRDSLCASNLCIDRCPDDGDYAKCPGYFLSPYLSPTAPVNQERDTVSQRRLGGLPPLEQLSVHYHADRGALRSDVRVIRDGNGTWNEDFGTNYYAPAEPGFARVWVVVRDNRGGVDWISTPLYIR